MVLDVAEDSGGVGSWIGGVESVKEDGGDKGVVTVLGSEDK
jgi:hypothetical protein